MRFGNHDNGYASRYWLKEYCAALVTLVGVLVEVPVRLSVMPIVNRSKSWYERSL